MALVARLQLPVPDRLAARAERARPPGSALISGSEVCIRHWGACIPARLGGCRESTEPELRCRPEGNTTGAGLCVRNSRPKHFGSKGDHCIRHRKAGRCPNSRSARNTHRRQGPPIPVVRSLASLRRTRHRAGPRWLAPSNRRQSPPKSIPSIAWPSLLLAKIECFLRLFSAAARR